MDMMAVKRLPTVEDIPQPKFREVKNKPITEPSNTYFRAEAQGRRKKIKE